MKKKFVLVFFILILDVDVDVDDEKHDGEFLLLKKVFPDKINRQQQPQPDNHQCLDNQIILTTKTTTTTTTKSSTTDLTMMDADSSTGKS